MARSFGDLPFKDLHDTRCDHRHPHRLPHLPQLPNGAPTIPLRPPPPTPVSPFSELLQSQKSEISGLSINPTYVDATYVDPTSLEIPSKLIDDTMMMLSMSLPKNESHQSLATSASVDPLAVNGNVNENLTTVVGGIGSPVDSNTTNNSNNNNSLSLAIPENLTRNLTGNLNGNLTGDVRGLPPNSPIPSATTARWEEEHSLGIWSPKQQVISKPGTLSFAIEDHHEFVIVASDGLWDVFTPQVGSTPVYYHPPCTTPSAPPMYHPYVLNHVLSHVLPPLPSPLLPLVPP